MKTHELEPKYHAMAEKLKKLKNKNIFNWILTRYIKLLFQFRLTRLKSDFEDNLITREQYNSWSSTIKPTPNNKITGELYDTPRKIKVEKFFEIMKTSNLNLLKVNQQAEVNETTLDNAWLDLTEYYYSKTSQKSFDNFKRNIKRVVLINSEITSCLAALEQIKLGDERGFITLKKNGINATDFTQIQSAINAKLTKLELAKNKLDTGNKEEEKASFLKIVSAIERELGFALPIEKYSLERWCEMIEDLREKREAEKQYYNQQKSKRHGR